LDGIECRRSREETSIQLRKNRKDELLRKKRMMGGANMIQLFSSQDDNDGTSSIDNTTLCSVISRAPTTSNEIDLEIAFCMKVFQRWVNPRQDIVTQDELVSVAKKLRRMLSVEKNPPVLQVLNSGALFFLVELLSPPENFSDPALVFEASWALTNIASTAFTERIVQHPGTVDKLASLLKHDCPHVREQAGWCLGNIAGDKNEFRDMLLQNKSVVDGMIVNLEEPHSSSLLQNLCWSVSNLCRGKPQPPISAIRPFIYPLYSVIRRCIDSFANNTIAEEGCSLHSMISDAMWCMSYLSDGDNSRIQIVLEECENIVGCLNDIMKQANKIDRSLLIPAVRCIGNLVSGTHEQTSVVVTSGVLKYIPLLLENPSVRFFFHVLTILFLKSKVSNLIFRII
jgi:importin subunit alpha-6/7